MGQESSGNMIVRLIRPILVFLLEIHFIRFVLLLFMSLVYDTYTSVLFHLNNISPKREQNHDDCVRSVQDQVKEWRKNGMKKPMCTSRPSYKSVTPAILSYKERMHKIEVELGNIVSIDERNKTVRVQPRVTIGRLTDYLIQLGWMVPIVPEIDDVTVGGLILGGGLETTSHKYGAFHNLCQSYELVLSDGSVVTCDKNNYRDLYDAVPVSYGTLGFLVSVTIDIIPYKPYLKHTYYSVTSIDELVNKFEKETEDPSNDTVEGIMFSKDKSVVMSGEYVDDIEDKNIPVNAVDRWYKPWFYIHVLDLMFNNKDDNENNNKTNRKYVEYIPTKDYFHRHNKCIFWMLRYDFGFANHPLFRYPFGWMMPPKFSFFKMLRIFMKQTGEEPPNLIAQDIGFTMETMSDALKYVNEETNIYPLWLCPITCLKDSICNSQGKSTHSGMHVDFGVYGFSDIKGFRRETCLKKIEKFCIENGGHVALYGETQLTREQFYEMFHPFIDNYDVIRKKYDCEKAFPHVYEKISKLGRS